MEGTVRLVDVIDMVLVAALVTGLLVWVRKIRVGRVAAGLVAVLAVYLGARYLGLSLLSGLFEGTFALFILIAVVIFQRELRRLFETMWLPGVDRSRLVTSEHSQDVLVESLFSFASRGVGALVVMPGKESVEPHVSGGVELSGKLSRPLLHSIFDPHSPGHDGASILQGDRISRFAVHLPLSTNYQLLEDMGTRHAAALGLSEHCDAVCVVVSEERHSVSVARGGELSVMRSAPELRALLEESQQAETSVLRSESGALAWLRHHWAESFISLAVVSGLWFVLVSGSVPIERTYRLPVRVVDVPTELTLVEFRPQSVEVTFRGPSRELRPASAADFEVAVDVALARVGQRSFAIREEDIQHPYSLEIIQIEPRRIELTATEK